jgi:EAL domain-containing protein (putative c-di-GMP-specific phosphodiesterase class I)
MSIEITESLPLEADAPITELLHRLHEHGIRVAIDDFGTGFSSLSYLHKFEIDCVKIDQSFIRDLHAERNARALCESIIAMAHKLGLTVVAEGVETREQRDFLASVGCDFAQGYHFSRPVPPEEFGALLSDGLPNTGASPDIDW